MHVMQIILRTALGNGFSLWKIFILTDNINWVFAINCHFIIYSSPYIFRKPFSIYILIQLVKEIQVFSEHKVNILLKYPTVEKYGLVGNAKKSPLEQVFFNEVYHIATSVMVRRLPNGFLGGFLLLVSPKYLDIHIQIPLTVFYHMAVPMWYTSFRKAFIVWMWIRCSTCRLRLH